MSERLTPAEWCERTGVVILDPDGWDRSNFTEDWAKPLDWDEFERKAAMSTSNLAAIMRQTGQGIIPAPCPHGCCETLRLRSEALARVIAENERLRAKTPRRVSAARPGPTCKCKPEIVWRNQP